MLEAAKHYSSCFLTLTYDQVHHPADGSLNPAHLRDWLKRFRWALSPLPLRYYAVGEYGDQTQRPHYHAAMFGVGPECSVVVERTWTMGFTQVGPLTPQSAAYVAGYVVKKMTRSDDARLNGRKPEFARMSLRPGIGSSAMEDVATVLSTRHGAKLVSALGDVPTTLQCGTRSMPLGRYLKTRLRAELGLAVVANETLEVRTRAAEMLALRDRVGRVAFRSFKPMVEHQRILNMETRYAIHSKKVKL